MTVNIITSACMFYSLILLSSTPVNNVFISRIILFSSLVLSSICDEAGTMTANIITSACVF